MQRSPKSAKRPSSSGAGKSRMGSGARKAASSAAPPTGMATSEVVSRAIDAATPAPNRVLPMPARGATGRSAATAARARAVSVASSPHSRSRPSMPRRARPKAAAVAFGRALLRAWKSLDRLWGDEATLTALFQAGRGCAPARGAPSGRRQHRVRLGVGASMTLEPSSLVAIPGRRRGRGRRLSWRRRPSRSFQRQSWRVASRSSGCAASAASLYWRAPRSWPASGPSGRRAARLCPRPGWPTAADPDGQWSGCGQRRSWGPAPVELSCGVARFVLPPHLAGALCEQLAARRAGSAGAPGAARWPGPEGGPRSTRSPRAGSDPAATSSLSIEQALGEPVAQAALVERLLVARLEATIPGTAPVIHLALELDSRAPSARCELGPFNPQSANAAPPRLAARPASPPPSASARISSWQVGVANSEASLPEGRTT